MTNQLDERTIWVRLRRELSVGDVFHTWSNTGRARNVPFAIEDLNNQEILIRRQNDGKQYKIFRSSIEGIAEIWADYLSGKATRNQMSFSRASSYVLGIFAKLTGKVS